MEELRQLVQNIVIIVMLAVFLELLLPSGSMQNYIKMVMGLLVIIAVLQMVFKFTNTDFNLHVPEFSSVPSVSLEQVQADALQLTDHYKSQAVEEYRRGIAKQVLALAQLNQELTVVDARVDVDTTEGEGFGKLQLIQLVVSAKTEQNQKIQPIEISVINQSPQGIPEEQIPSDIQQSMDKLAVTVANFYNLPLEQVQVIYIS